MASKWFAIKQVEALTHDAPVGYVGLRLLCYTKLDGSRTECFPAKRSKPWPFPEERANELIRSLSQADQATPLKERPRIRVTITDGIGAFTGFWPGPSTFET